MDPVGNQNFWQPGDDDTSPASDSSQYAGYDLQDGPDVDAPEVGRQPISWQASEYIHHQKDALWFMGLVVVVAILAALALFLIRSWTFAALIIVMAIAVIVYARRPPRLINYLLDQHGLQVNEKQYDYHDFRAFGVVQDGPLYSVILIPVKRFMPSVTVYFPQESGEAVVDALGAHVPMEHLELDFVEKIVRKLRF